jgi:L-rhamnose mutarotase
MSTLLRFAQVVNVKPEMREEYLRLHAQVWPQVENTIRGCNITNYTIFIHGALLVGYFEYSGDDFEQDMARMAADPVTQEWWSFTDPCQEPVPDARAGELWSTATEVWHLP